MGGMYRSSVMRAAVVQRGGLYPGRVRNPETWIVTVGKHVLALHKEAPLISELSKHAKNSLWSQRVLGHCLENLEPDEVLAVT